jgi:hypothetical protein
MKTNLVNGGTCDHMVARKDTPTSTTFESCGKPALVVLTDQYHRPTYLCHHHAEDLMSRLQEIVADDD